MKKLLNRLLKEGKLKLIEPSIALGESYFEKSRSNLVSARILLDSGQLEESVALVYYSMYHTLQALLFRAGIKSESHVASIYLLKEMFKLENKEIEYAKEERLDKQYSTGFSITKKEVEDSLIVCEDFNKKIFDFVSRMNTKDADSYRDAFRRLTEK